MEGVGGWGHPSPDLPAFSVPPTVGSSRTGEKGEREEEGQSKGVYVGGWPLASADHKRLAALDRERHQRTNEGRRRKGEGRGAGVEGRGEGRVSSTLWTSTCDVSTLKGPGLDTGSKRDRTGRNGTQAKNPP